jgi:hypothetical protein
MIAGPARARSAAESHPMRQTLAFTAALLVLAACGGCGMEAVDNTMRTRGEMGTPDTLVVRVSDSEFVCPHIVTINNRQFSAAEVQRGDVEGAFGPFVPCGTIVPAGVGECPSCHGKYRTSGPPDEEHPLALPKIMSPFGDDPIDMVAIQVKGNTDPKVPDRLAPNMDPVTKRYYEMAPADVATTVGPIEEVLSPTGVAFDPTSPSYKAGADAKVGRVLSSIEGPCWRCGGTGDCLDCGDSGAGAGKVGVYGATPTDCWACGGEGRCPECGGTGFAAYEGGLPQSFAMTRGGKDNLEDLPSEPPKDNPKGPTRAWRHAPQPPITSAPATEGGDVKPPAGAPEAPETPPPAPPAGGEGH